MDCSAPPVYGAERGVGLTENFLFHAKALHFGRDPERDPLSSRTKGTAPHFQGRSAHCNMTYAGSITTQQCDTCLQVMGILPLIAPPCHPPFIMAVPWTMCHTPFHLYSLPPSTAPATPLPHAPSCPASPLGTVILMISSSKALQRGAALAV